MLLKVKDRKETRIFKSLSSFLHGNRFLVNTLPCLVSILAINMSLTVTQLSSELHPSAVWTVILQTPGISCFLPFSLLSRICYLFKFTYLHFSFLMPPLFFFYLCSAIPLIHLTGCFIYFQFLFASNKSILRLLSPPLPTNLFQLQVLTCTVVIFINTYLVNCVLYFLFPFQRRCNLGLLLFLLLILMAGLLHFYHHLVMSFQFAFVVKIMYFVLCEFAFVDFL